MRTISNLQNQKSKLLESAQLLVDAGLRTAEQKAEYKKLVDEASVVQQDLDSLARIERAMPSLIAAPAPTPAPAPVIEVVPESVEKRKAKVNLAVRNFFKHGIDGLNAEQRAIVTTSDAAGGSLISQDFDKVFVEASKFFGNIWNMIHRHDALSGQPVKAVYADTTAQSFSLVSEGTTSASSIAQTPTVFSDIINTDSLVSSFIFSVQELSDAFDLTEFLTRNAGLAVSRAREQAITLATTNDGTSTALPSSPSGGLLASVGTTLTQSSGTLAAGVTLSQLNALAASVDRSYYQMGAFMASPSVEAALRALEDSTGRRLIPIDPETGLLSIQGKLLWPNNSMAAAGTPSVPLVLFGQFDKAYSVLSTGIRIDVIANNESPALSWNTREMIVYTRIGAAAGLNSAVKALVSAAS